MEVAVMLKIPATVVKRLKAEIPKFQKILEAARSQDINEADTVVIVTDMLEQVFGLDKYTDISRKQEQWDQVGWGGFIYSGLDPIGTS